jgi:hypothetical protein
MGTHYEVLPYDPGAESLRIVEFRKWVRAGAEYGTSREILRIFRLDTDTGLVRAGQVLTSREWMSAKSGTGLRWRVAAEPFSGGDWCLRLQTGYGRWKRLTPPTGRFRERPAWTLSVGGDGPVLFACVRSRDRRWLRFLRLDVEGDAWSDLPFGFRLRQGEQPVYASACTSTRFYVVLKGGPAGTRTVEGDFASSSGRDVAPGYLLAANRDGSLLDRHAARLGRRFLLRRWSEGRELHAVVPDVGADHLSVRTIPGRERFLLEYGREGESYPQRIALADFNRVLAVLGSPGGEAGTLRGWRFEWRGEATPSGREEARR